MRITTPPRTERFGLCAVGGCFGDRRGDGREMLPQCNKSIYMISNVFAYMKGRQADRHGGRRGNGRGQMDYHSNTLNASTSQWAALLWLCASTLDV